VCVRERECLSVRERVKKSTRGRPGSAASTLGAEEGDSERKEREVESKSVRVGKWKTEGELGAPRVGSAHPARGRGDGVR
jgi:hypothetical protein